MNRRANQSVSNIVTGEQILHAEFNMYVCTSDLQV